MRFLLVWGGEQLPGGVGVDGVQHLADVLSHRLFTKIGVRIGMRL